MVPLELLAVLVPLQSGSWVAVGLTSKLHSLAGRDGVKLFLHFFWMSPLWSHRYRGRQKKQLAFEFVFSQKKYFTPPVLSVEIITVYGQLKTLHFSKCWGIKYVSVT